CQFAFIRLIRYYYLSCRLAALIYSGLASRPLSSNCHAFGIYSGLASHYAAQLEELAASQLLIHFGIEGVAHPVSEEGEGQHGDGDGDGGKDAQVPVRTQVLLILSHHLSPGRGRGVDPHSDEGQRRLREDGLGNAEGDRHHDGREGARQHMLRDGPEEARAQGARALDELLLLDGEHLGAGLARDAHPAREPDGDEDV